jgi:ParB family chromosome partitioning protein
VGLFIKRRKEIYEALHPETKHGATLKRGSVPSSQIEKTGTPSFVEDTAEKLNVSKATVYRMIAEAEEAEPEPLPSPPIVRTPPAKAEE